MEPKIRFLASAAIGLAAAFAALSVAAHYMLGMHPLMGFALGMATLPTVIVACAASWELLGIFGDDRS